MSTNAYVNDVLTEHKHKHTCKHAKKAYAYAYVAAVLISAQASHAYVYAYACVASEDQALCTSQIEASTSPRAFEFLENVCSNHPLTGLKSCSNAPTPGKITRLLF